MRNDEARLQILGEAASAFQRGRSGKLPHIRRAVTVAEDTDRRLGTAFFSTLSTESGLRAGDIKNPDTRACKGHIGRLADAFSILLRNHVYPMCDDIHLSQQAREESPASAPEPKDGVDRAIEKMQLRASL